MTNSKNSFNTSDTDKIKLEHVLSLRRILIDRLMIGAFFGAAAFIGALFVEKYKASNAATQYFVVERMEAAKELRGFFNPVLDTALKAAAARCRNDQVDTVTRSNLKDYSRNMKSILEKNSILFSEKYVQQARLVLEVYSDASQAPDAAIECDSNYFFSELSDYFSSISKSEINGEDRSDWKSFSPIQKTRQQLDMYSAGQYFSINYSSWKR